MFKRLVKVINVILCTTIVPYLIGRTLQITILYKLDKFWQCQDWFEMWFGGLIFIIVSTVVIGLVIRIIYYIIHGQ